MKPTVRVITCLFVLFLFCAVSSFALPDEQPSEHKDPGTISGKILKQSGKPFTPGFVAFFSSDNLEPMDYGQTRRSPKMISFLNDKGEFSTHEMPPGSYYIGVMERQRWRGGPPKKDEKRYSAFDDQGKYRVVSLKSGETLDIGSIKVKEPDAFPELTDYFTIGGRLITKEGEGIPDVVVVVKRDYNSPKADFISDKTAFNGYYNIKLPPGKYYLIARETVEGSMRPKPGSLYGELGQVEAIGIGGKSSSPATFVAGVKGKEYENVDIMMFKVPVPDLKRKETEALVKAEKYSREDLADNLPLRKKAAVGSVEKKLQEVKDKK